MRLEQAAQANLGFRGSDHESQDAGVSLLCSLAQELFEILLKFLKRRAKLDRHTGRAVLIIATSHWGRRLIRKRDEIFLAIQHVLSPRMHLIAY